MKRCILPNTPGENDVREGGPTSVAHFIWKNNAWQIYKWSVTKWAIHNPDDIEPLKAGRQWHLRGPFGGTPPKKVPVSTLTVPGGTTSRTLCLPLTPVALGHTKQQKWVCAHTAKGCQKRCCWAPLNGPPKT